MLEDIIRIAMVVPLGDDPSAEDCIWGIPTLVWGDPGIGKSMRIKKLAALLRMYCALVFPSGRLPEDFAGVPVQDGKGGLKLVSTMQAIMELCEIGEGILYLDEINTARAAVQATLHGVVLDRRSGDLIFPPKVRIVAAANPIELSTGGHPLEIALSNRFMHIDQSPSSPKEWAKWRMGMMKKKEPTPIVDLEEMVTENWDKTWPEVYASYCQFIESKDGGAMLHAIPSVGHEDRHKAFPTERMWDWASRISVVCKILKTGPMIEQLMIAGCVGHGAADEYLKYRMAADLPTPKDVLDKGFKVDKIRQDRSYAVYRSLVVYVVELPEKQKVKMGVRAWALLEEGCKAGLGDLLYDCAEYMVTNGMGSLGGKELATAAEPVINRFPGKLIEMAKAVSAQAAGAP